MEVYSYRKKIQKIDTTGEELRRGEKRHQEK